MNTASLELCKTLHELSGWGDTHAFWSGNDLQFDGEAEWGDVHRPEYNIRQSDLKKGELYDDYPAYDLGYLLRKLPQWTQISKNSDQAEAPYLAFNSSFDNKLKAIESGDEFAFEKEGDTAEDAVCKLAIELFRQGILTKGDQD